MAFPCLDALESRSADLRAGLRPSHSPSQSPSQSPSPSALPPAPSPSATSGPEPSYTSGATLTFRSSFPLLLDWGGVLPEFAIAYETWGSLDAAKSNAILLHTGLSASSHAAATPANLQPGWWEQFVGPGRPLDTDRFFVVCTNILGGCYGSTGPASLDPSDGKPYATRFPILTMEDMVRAQFRLLDSLGIDRLHAAVGASMGGMQSLAAGVLFPARVGRAVSISGCARSHPYSIAMRHTQRQVLMMDPNWNRGFYYGDVPPHAGLKLAREIATVTYRSGPEWEARFGRRRADPAKRPALCPDYLIETYLDHAGEKFCLTYDANSMLYVSKAMDLFDLGRENQLATAARRGRMESRMSRAADWQGDCVGDEDDEAVACGLTLPDTPYQEQQQQQQAGPRKKDKEDAPPTPPSRTPPPPPPPGPPADLVAGLVPMGATPTLVMGVASDILFPSWQQREVAEALRMAGNGRVTHVELSEEVSRFGHDTFLLDLTHIGSSLKQFVEAET